MSLRNKLAAKPILCYVTDRTALNHVGGDSKSQVIGKILQAAGAGVDWIQIREKGLGGRACEELVSQAVQIAREARQEGHEIRILVNDRLDVALAEGADGVHLGEDSLPVAAVRRLAPAGFLVGASAHSLERAKAAASHGAGYLVFGPVFATPSKAALGQPQGLQRLAEICESVTIPVLAIGGITLENAHQCKKAGAAGIAAIRLFQDSEDLLRTIEAIRCTFN